MNIKSLQRTEETEETKETTSTGTVAKSNGWTGTCDNIYLWYLTYLIIFGCLNILLVLESKFQSNFSIIFLVIFFIFCSLAWKIPGWVIERIIESTSEKTTGSITVEIFEKYHVVWLLFEYSWVLTWPELCTWMYELCRTWVSWWGWLLYHGRCEVGDGSSTVGSCMSCILLLSLIAWKVCNGVLWKITRCA